MCVCRRARTRDKPGVEVQGSHETERGTLSALLNETERGTLEHETERVRPFR